ncbi:MAG: hypothetical protein ACREQR_19075 [Candidatus Binataceae bacterium]
MDKLKVALEDAKAGKYVIAYDGLEQVRTDPAVLEDERTFAQGGICYCEYQMMSPLYKPEQPLPLTFSLDEQFQACEGAEQLATIPTYEHQLPNSAYEPMLNQVREIQQLLAHRFEKQITQALQRNDLEPACTALLADYRQLPNPNQNLIADCEVRTTSKEIAAALQAKDLAKALALIDQYKALPNHDARKLSSWLDEVAPLQAAREEEETQETQAREKEHAREVKLVDKFSKMELKALKRNEPLVTSNCASDYDKELASKRTMTIAPADTVTALGQNPYATSDDITKAQANILILKTAEDDAVVFERERNCLQGELKTPEFSEADANTIIDCESHYFAKVFLNFQRGIPGPSDDCP